ncbi:MAG: 4-alpha-glucanotransferase [Candidatus Omnitrophota bacterium]|nr:4-alpha-glucanotransferase [Candidatus Omnitrophota bacterium]
MSQIALSISRNNWKNVGKKRRAGVLAPLFSLYSSGSAGVGDFRDLGLFSEWCKRAGLSILQLLPMNETGSTFCPYDAVSSFALEPMYISLEGLPESGDRAVRAKIANLKKKFPAGKKHVHYGIKNAKLTLLRQIFSSDGKGNNSEDFKAFVSENEYWIDDFALFKVLKAYHEGRPWHEWADGYRDRDFNKIDAFRKDHALELDFEKWMQWIAFSQFKSARKYAAAKGVLICGDIPILTSRDSADVWAHREFFKLDLSSGAPTDMYCAKGQRWSMPVYDWDAIANDGYRYIKEKLKFAENFYDMIRIDHVVGLFRIWSIPYNEPPESEGLNGSFDPADEKAWKGHGRAILSVMLNSASMLLTAEDLGMIPKECTEALREFEIPGNEVQRWVKGWTTSHDFLEPKEYRLFSVAMLSTHDTANWPAWWENEAGTVDEALFVRRAAGRNIDCESTKINLFDPDLSRHGRLRWRKSVTSADLLAAALGKRKEEIADFVDMYENSYLEKEKLWKHLGLKGDMKEKSDPKIVEAALNVTFSSKSIFCIELLTDYLYMADMLKGDPYQNRINRPGTVNKNNWSMVIPLSLEELLARKVGAKIKNMVISARRSYNP